MFVTKEYYTKVLSHPIFSFKESAFLVLFDVVLKRSSSGFLYTLIEKTLFHVGTLSVMDWPPQNLDLNIIEARWDYLDRKGRQHSKKIY